MSLSRVQDAVTSRLLFNRITAGCTAREKELLSSDTAKRVYRMG